MNSLYRYCKNVHEPERNALKKKSENCELPQQLNAVLPKRIGLLLLILIEKDPRDQS